MKKAPGLLQIDRITIEDNTFIDYKDILLHNKTVSNSLVVSKVTYSRFKIILNGYLALNGLNFPGVNMEDMCDHYSLSIENNERGNVYKIIKEISKEQEEAESTKCSCTDCLTLPSRKRRYVAKGHTVCFYTQRHEKNYTTRI